MPREGQEKLIQEQAGKETPTAKTKTQNKSQQNKKPDKQNRPQHRGIKTTTPDLPNQKTQEKTAVQPHSKSRTGSDLATKTVPRVPNPLIIKTRGSLQPLSTPLPR
jgi:hypothetical protein